MCKAWHQYNERSRALALLNSPPVEVPVDPLPSRDHRQLAVRHARRSVKRAVRRMVSYYLQKEHHYYGVAFSPLLSHGHSRWLP